MTSISVLFIVVMISMIMVPLDAFVPVLKQKKSVRMNMSDDETKESALDAAINAMYGGVPLQEDPQLTQQRIQTLVDQNPILLFMKGSRIFPQCGFSNTATQILESFKVDFFTVDVLADQAIRQGVKEFSQWPTIPQLYIQGEFIGGSDIMIDMYQSGELKEMIDKIPKKED